MTQDELTQQIINVTHDLRDLQSRIENRLKAMKLGMGHEPNTTTWLCFQAEERRLRRRLHQLGDIGLRRGWIEEVDPDDYM